WLDRDAEFWRYDPATRGTTRVGRMTCPAVRRQLVRDPRRAFSCQEDEDAGVPPPSTLTDDVAGELAARREAAAPAAVLVVPLSLGESALGAFLLGPKRSGLPFTREEMDLVRTLAAQSAIAVQNARSYRALQSLNSELEEKVKGRTAELVMSNA